MAHYDLRFLKPIDEEMLHEVGRNFKKVLTIEDGILKGGMGSAVLEFLSDNDYYPIVKRLGIPDHFIQHGPVQDLRAICGYDCKGIYQTLMQLIKS